MSKRIVLVVLGMALLCQREGFGSESSVFKSDTDDVHFASLSNYYSVGNFDREDFGVVFTFPFSALDPEEHEVHSHISPSTKPADEFGFVSSVLQITSSFNPFSFSYMQD